MSKRHRTSPAKSIRACAFGLAPRDARVDPTNQQTAEDILRRSFRVGSPRRLGWARDVRRRRRAVAAVAVAVAIAAAVAVAVAIAVVVVVVAAFRAYAGADASKQPPDMPDVFPDETAVAWTRQRQKKYPLTKGAGLGAMERELADRLDECKKHINAAYDVGDLCSSYTRRMEDPPRNLIHPPQWIVRGPQGRAALCRWLA